MSRTRFQPEFVDIARELVERGVPDWHIARELNVSDKAIRAWKQAHPEFAAAMRRPPRERRHLRPNEVRALREEAEEIFRELLSARLATGYSTLQLTLWASILASPGVKGACRLVGRRGVPGPVQALAARIIESTGSEAGNGATAGARGSRIPGDWERRLLPFAREERRAEPGLAGLSHLGKPNIFLAFRNAGRAGSARARKPVQQLRFTRG